MYELTQWQRIFRIVIRGLFKKAYQERVLPDRVEIEIEPEFFRHDRSLQEQVIGFCLGIGWAKAILEEKKSGNNKGMFLVLERRAQKRFPSG